MNSNCGKIFIKQERNRKMRAEARKETVRSVRILRAVSIVSDGRWRDGPEFIIGGSKHDYTRFLGQLRFKCRLRGRAPQYYIFCILVPIYSPFMYVHIAETVDDSGRVWVLCIVRM